MIVSLRELVNPTRKQQQFLEAVKTHQYVLYGGSAGSGKSYILRWALVGLLLKWAKELGLRGVRVGLFCEDYNALRDRHLSKIRYEFPSWLGNLKEHVHEYHLADRYGAGVICFRNLDDPSKYLSSEFAAIAVDELTRNDKEVFDVLRMRLRWPGIERPPFMGATNPGGKGHLWVKRFWIDRDFDEELRPLADEVAYVPARPDDNPYLPSSYVAALKSLPEKLRRAYLEGDWDVFEGQYFSEWRREIHVVRPFELPGWWKRFRSLDYGLDCTACYWWAVAQDGRCYAYRELYEPGLTLSQAAKRIIAMTPAEERIEYTVASPDLWNRRQDTGLAGYEIMSQAGLRGLIRADDRRVAGWRALREYLTPYQDEQGQTVARLAVFETCANLIRTLPALVHDPNDPEDVDDHCEDHAVESTRYGVMSRPPVSLDEEERERRRKVRERATQPVISRITGY